MALRVPIKDLWAEQQIFVRRAIAAFVLVLIVLVAVAVRLTILQVIHFEHFRELSRGNRVRIEPIPPTRGLIFDRNGVLLAENLPAYQLEITPEEVPEMDRTLARLGTLVEVRKRDVDRFRRALGTHRRFDAIPLKFRLTEEEVARIAVHLPHFPGVEIRARLARFYPLGGSAVHALGYVASISEKDLERIVKADYVGTTHIGKTGVERAYEEFLHGQAGHRQVLVNAQGRALRELEKQPPVPGNDLFLSLDVRMQAAAEAALRGHRGAVVAIDPRDGSVLALASTPTFDPNPFGEGLSRGEYAALSTNPDKPLFNRALRGSYPPGSTIKPMLALAGLYFNAIAPHEARMCRGYFMLPGNPHRYRDWKTEGHGAMNLHDAIVQSCDIYFYELATELGIDRMNQFMTTFGFGQRSGIDILGEKSGLMPSREWKERNFNSPAERVWFPGETVITGIGQGFMLSTPLQLAHATATLAARGRRYQPRLVTAIRDSRTGERRERPAKPLPAVPVHDEGMWDQVLLAMDDVVNGPRGTARRIGIDSTYRIAGKTGTAQVFTVGQDEEYDAEEIDERLRDHAWFIAYAPVGAPEVALAVMVENGGSGSRSAAPLARQVLDSYFHREEESTVDHDIRRESAVPGAAAAGHGGQATGPAAR